MSVHGPGFWQRTWDVGTNGAPQGGPEAPSPPCAVCAQSEELRRVQECPASGRKGAEGEEEDLLLLEEEEDELEEGVEEEAEEDEEVDGGDADQVEGSRSQMEWERTGGSAAGAPLAPHAGPGPTEEGKAGGREASHKEGKHRFRGMPGAPGLAQSSQPESTSSSRGVQLVVKRRWAPRYTGPSEAAQAGAALGRLGAGLAAGPGPPYPERSAADPLLLLSEALLLQLPSPNTRPGCAPTLNWPKVIHSLGLNGP